MPEVPAPGRSAHTGGAPLAAGAGRSGLPLWAVVALGLVAVPRAVLHDLDRMPDSRLLVVALAVGPPILWTGVAVAARLVSPVRTMAAVGAVYGVALGLVHNLLWDRAFGHRDVRLGGELRGTLPAAVEELLLRGATTLSSLLTGLAVGLVTGLVAMMATRLLYRR